MPLRVLIIEDELQSRKSHHFQYQQGVIPYLQNEGGHVEILCNNAASADVVAELNAEPLLAGISSAAVQLIRNPIMRKLAVIKGIIGNAFTVIRKLRDSHYDAILIPTAWFQHVLLLIPILLLRARSIDRVCLIFVQCGSNSVSARRRLKWLKRLLATLQRLHPKVQLYTETRAAKRAFESESSLRFRIIPHAVAPSSALRPEREESTYKPVIFGFYGFARYEQGADILLQAIRSIINTHPHLNVKFNIVWPNGFRTPNGEWVEPDAEIEQSGKVTFYRSPLNSTEYQKTVSTTDWIILPYRSGSYFGRISRVSIEACCLGIPGIYTEGTSQEEVFTAYGAGIGIPESDAHSLAQAILKAHEETRLFHQIAQQKQVLAKRAFSPKAFWQILFE